MPNQIGSVLNCQVKMSISEISADSSPVSRADNVTHKLEAALNTVSGLMIFFLVLLATANVLGRKLFNTPLPGFIDWVEQSMAVFAFAGLAYCQRYGSHIRMDIVIQRLKGRRLWFAELVSSLLILLVTSVLIYGSWFHFLRSVDLSAPLFSRDSSIDIGLPLWPAKLVVPVSLALLWIRLVIQIWGYSLALKSGEDSPVAVPVPRSIVQQAAQESEAMDAN